MTDSLKIFSELKLPNFSDIVSPIAFGGASISGEGGGYGFGPISHKDSIDLLEYAYALGINVYDTAPIYGFGISEARLSEFIQNKREKILLISKSGVDWHPNQRVNMTNDPVSTEKMLNESLKRLNSDYIDLYMIHWPDKAVDIRRPLEVLSRAKKEGKIRMIGLCNTNANDLALALEIEEIHMVQSEFNLFNQDEIKRNLFPILIEKNIPFMGWGPLDKGVLNFSITPNREYAKEDCRSWAPWWNKKEMNKKAEVVFEFKNFLKLSFVIKIPDFEIKLS